MQLGDTEGRNPPDSSMPDNDPHLPATPRYRALMRGVLGAHALNGAAAVIGLFLVALVASRLWGTEPAIGAGVGAVIALLPHEVRARRGTFAHLVIAPLVGIPLYLMVQLLRPEPLALGLFLVPGTFLAFLSTAWGRRGMPVSAAVMFAMLMALAPAPAIDPAEALQRTAWCAFGAGLYVLYGTMSNALLNGRFRSQTTADLLLATAALLRTHARRVELAVQPAATPTDGVAEGEILRRHAALTDQLQAARDLILETPDRPSRQRLAGMLVIALEMRDRMIASELDSARLGLCSRPTLGRFAAMWHRMAEDVERVADSLLSGKQPPPAWDHEPELEATRRQGHQQEFGANCDPTIEQALIHSISVRLGDLNSAVRRLAELARGEAEPDLAAVRSGWRLFVSPAYWPRPSLRRLHWRQPALRHALRAGLAVGTGFLLAQWVPWVSRDYWILLTIAVVLRGSLAQTLVRRNDRVLGTLAGSLLALGVLMLRPPVVWLLVIAGVAQGVAHAFAARRYLVTAVAASVLGLILASLLRAGGSPTLDVLARILDTLLGAGIAWGFSYVLPAWERGQLATLVGRVCGAIREHARHSLALAAHADITGQPELAWRLARREAYDAFSALVQATDRALVEPRAVRPPIAALEQLQGHGYQLLGQLSAVQSILLLRRERLRLDELAPAIAQTAAELDMRLDLASPCALAERSLPEDAGRNPGLRALPEDLPDPRLPDSGPWLLHRLHLADALAARVRADAERVLTAVTPRRDPADQTTASEARPG